MPAVKIFDMRNRTKDAYSYVTPMFTFAEGEGGPSKSRQRIRYKAIPCLDLYSDKLEEYPQLASEFAFFLEDWLCPNITGSYEIMNTPYSNEYVKYLWLETHTCNITNDLTQDYSRTCSGMEQNTTAWNDTLNTFHISIKFVGQSFDPNTYSEVGLPLVVKESI